MAQASKGNRRGDVFSVRLTPEQRARLDALQAEGGGPRAVGPWLVWRALDAIEVIPARAGTTPAEVLPGPGPGNTSPARYYQRDRRPAPPPHHRLILDLCGGSGSWSAPYAAAGYRVEVVTLPVDVRTYVPPRDVWGLLAAPPCDQFSLARNPWNTREGGRPRDFVRGMECVNACLRIVQQARPRWWALENPVGLLGRWLGVPRDVWEPCDFGDPWTKRTAIWGSYTIPRRGPFVRPLGGGPFCALCDPERRKTTWCSDSGHRAVTPPGFARAFFEANP